MTIQRARPAAASSPATATAAAAALLLLPSIATTAAYSGDGVCQLPGAPPYTGYALMPDTECKNYAYCQSGVISAVQGCGDGLLYNGSIGAGGICTWPSSVICAPSSSGGGGGGVGGGGGANNNPPPPPPVPANPIPAPANTQAVYSAQNGFCGRDLADAQSTCRQTCQTSDDCCSPSEACFSTGSSCADVDHSGPTHFYCGNSWCDAADDCGIRCPSGTDSDCPVGMGCFANVPCDGGGGDSSILGAFLNANANSGNSNNSNNNSNNNNNNNDILNAFLNAHTATTTANSANNDNPHNFFCGSSPADAMRICVPCPTGELRECGNDFTHGCFKGIDSCAASNSSSNQQQQQQQQPWQQTYQSQQANIQQQQQQQQQQTYQSQQQQQSSNNNNQGSNAQYYPQPYQPTPSTPVIVPAASVPAPAPDATLPPWTNAPFNPSPTSAPKTVIAYYASWQWYDRNKFADPANIDFTKYDRINYAFFQPDIHGNLYGTDEWADPQLLWGPYMYSGGGETKCSWDGPLMSDRKCNQHDTTQGIITLAHRVGVEVMPSIGGWTLSDNFPGIAADPGRREHFAQQCIELIEAYDFDGIDIDWEYPGYEDHSGTPADTVNFTLFLQAIRNKLDKLGAIRGKFYGLTAALPCGPDKIDKIQVNQIKNILTEFNLMSYDLHGAWDTLTGTNAPMFDQGWTDKTERWSVHGCVNNYVELGIPKMQINIGLPFYGRSFQGATGMKQFHGGADDINYHLDEGSPQYFNIVNELKGMTTYRHESTQTQYAVFDKAGRGVVSYDDPRAICDKVHYANQRGLHGFLIWEISGDMIDRGDGTMWTPLADAMNHKISNPNYPCSNLHDPTWALKDTYYRYAPDEPDSVDWSNYVAPLGSSGSANDFNGAQVLAPAPGPTPPAYNTPQNAVYYNPSPPGNSGSTPAGGNPAGAGCPSGFTGYHAGPGCTTYMYCQNGSIVGEAMPCNPGMLYDVNIKVCNWAATVNC